MNPVVFSMAQPAQYTQPKSLTMTPATFGAVCRFDFVDSEGKGVTVENAGGSVLRWLKETYGYDSSEEIAHGIVTWDSQTDQDDINPIVLKSQSA